MLDSTFRDSADEHARQEFQAQEQAIIARLNWLKSGVEGDLPKPMQIVSGLNMDYTAISKLRDHAVKTLGLKAQDVEAAIRSERVRQALGAVPRHPLEFIHLLAERRGYAVRADGTIISPSGAEMLHRIMLG